MTEYVHGEIFEEQRSAFLALLSANGFSPAEADHAFDIALDVIRKDRGIAVTLEVEDSEELVGVLVATPFISDSGFHDVNTLVAWLLEIKPGIDLDAVPWQALLRQFVLRAMDRDYARVLCTAASSITQLGFLEGDMWRVAKPGHGVSWYGEGSDGDLWVCTQYPDDGSPLSRVAYFRLDDDDPAGSFVRQVPRTSSDDATALRLFGEDPRANG